MARVAQREAPGGGHRFGLEAQRRQVGPDVAVGGRLERADALDVDLVEMVGCELLPVRDVNHLAVADQDAGAAIGAEDALERPADLVAERVVCRLRLRNPAAVAEDRGDA